jgi:hypothetical protein
MVFHDSFVTRKPLEFTIIVLFAVFILLLPVYFYTGYRTKITATKERMIYETYAEVKYTFGPDSDIPDSEKRKLFKISYEGNTVQWTGTLMSCETMGSMYRVRVDTDQNDEFSEVIFTTFNNCTGIPAESTINYRMNLVDWKTNIFIGNKGEILKWD